MRKLSLLFSLALLLGLVGTTFAQDQEVYRVTFQPLNNSGVTGTATLRLDGNRLMVSIQARNLVPSMTHPQHIHGLPDASKNATCPPPSADDNGNGIVSLEEGMPFYGPVLVPLEPFPMAMGGTIDYQETLTVDPSKLRPLENRVIVLHGLRVGGEYMPTVPVACGQIEAGMPSMPSTGGGGASRDAAGLPGLSLALVALAGAGAFAFTRARRDRTV